MREELTPAEWIRRARDGDTSARSALLSQMRPFVFRLASKICRRLLDWRIHDELSVALIALNEAIDSYKTGQSSFEAHARTVIKNRLIDYFRKEQRHFGHLSLDVAATSQEDEEQPNLLEKEAAIASYNQAVAVRERAEEIEGYAILLAQYGLSLRDVMAAAPSHSDTRARVRAAAAFLAQDAELTAYLRRTKQLPISGLVQVTGWSRKFFEDHRRYLIGVTLLVLHREFEQLRTFAGLNGPVRERRPQS